MKPDYHHPRLTASYSRNTVDGETIHFFDVGNGHAVQVTESADRTMYTCEIYIIPQFKGASIYNSVKSTRPAMMTFESGDVDDFIDDALEAFMLEVKHPDELKEEFND